MRAALFLASALVIACQPSAPLPAEDSGMRDAGHEGDGDVDEDAGVEADAHVPGAGALRLVLRARVDGLIMEEPGEVEFAFGRLDRFDLGVSRLAFEGDRPGDPELLQVGLLSPLEGERSATVAPVAPGLYSGVDLSLRAGSWGPALEVEGAGLAEPYRILVDEGIDIELRCRGGSIDLGVGGHVEVPLYIEADAANEELAELPASRLSAALMERLVLACDEARPY